MDKINLLKVSPETRRTIKEQTIRLHAKGKKEAEIADSLNISYQAVSRIVRAYKKEGMHSVKEKTRGRKHGEKRILTPQQEKEIQIHFQLSGSLGNDVSTANQESIQPG